MKKFIAIFAVLLLAAPAMAADWSFYGSQRIATFYVADDYGDYKRADGESDDWGLQWNFQTNSRVGAKVKADKVEGQIELRLGGGAPDTDKNSGDGQDTTVGTRRAYGIWKFADNAALKIGKDYSPVSNLLFGQVFNSDDGMLGDGDFYGKRPAGLTLILGGFELAFLTNALKDSGANKVAPTGADVDWNIPKIEARYALKLTGFELIPYGGFQYFKVSSTQQTETAGTLTDDLDIYSYVLGLAAKFNVGAFYGVVNGAWGQNWSNANWDSGANKYSANFSSANLDDPDDIKDSTSYMVGAAIGLNFTPQLKFELGGSYRVDDSDFSGVDEAECLMGYLQAVITLAPGVYLVPEAGYYHYFDDPRSKADGGGDELGYQWYAGAKWQIDF